MLARSARHLLEASAMALRRLDAASSFALVARGTAPGQPAACSAASGIWRDGWFRSFQSSRIALHGPSEVDENAETITVTFVNEKDGSESPVKVPLGQNLLEAAHANDVELEGACEGSLACSTCHVIVEDPSYYEKMPEPDDDENDMLDLAFGLTDMSRLGCQVKATEELDGLRVRIPSATRNFAVDGHVPKPH